MNRLQATLLVIAVWAGIFLPGLGSTELKGEEGRRILPAVAMLDGGSWVVPFVGGRPFLHKPPLVNWAIAGSMALLHARTEWAARLPSALALLAIALAMLAISGSGRGYSLETAFIAAVFALTQLCSIEKGRMAEIEALYSALSGIGIVAWVVWTAEGRSPWLVWIVPLVLFGAALLAKGPFHLLFFYVIAVWVAFRLRESKILTHLAHWIGIALMVAIFAAWFIPYHHSEATLGAGDVWYRQSLGRVQHSNFAGWASNIPRALSDHLPWILLAPVLWRRDLEKLGNRNATIFRAVRNGMTACFFGLLLIPGVLPRYTMPLLAPFSYLIAIALADPRLDPPAIWLRNWWRANTGAALGLLLVACGAPVALVIRSREAIRNVNGASLGDYTQFLVWPLVASSAAFVICIAIVVARYKLARPWRIAAASGGLAIAAMWIFASSSTAYLRQHEVFRPVGEAINREVPPGKTIVLLDPGYQPALFYIRPPYLYVSSAPEIPGDASWVATTAKEAEHLTRTDGSFRLAAKLPHEKFSPLALLKRDR